MKFMSSGIRGRFEFSTGSLTLPHRFASLISHIFQGSRVIHHLCGKARRFWLVHAQKGYVSRQLSIRQGKCHQCGTCCNLLFTCPMLTKTGQCLVYSVCRPQSCKIFPIDQRDVDEVQLYGKQCGFKFRKEYLLVEKNDQLQ